MGFAGVLAVVLIVEICYTCKFNSRMNMINSKASKGEINADQLEVSRAQATLEFGVTLQRFAQVRGLVYLGWIVSYWYIVHKYQNDNTSDNTKLCKFKYDGMVTPFPELPTAYGSTLAGPVMEYRPWINILLLVPVFLIDFMIGRHL